MKEYRPRQPPPTPAEIVERTTEVRAMWSEATHRARAGLPRLKWTAPTIIVPQSIVELGKG